MVDDNPNSFEWKIQMNLDKQEISETEDKLSELLEALVSGDQFKISQTLRESAEKLLLLGITLPQTQLQPNIQLLTPEFRSEFLQHLSSATKKKANQLMDITKRLMKKHEIVSGMFQQEIKTYQQYTQILKTHLKALNEFVHLKTDLFNARITPAFGEPLQDIKNILDNSDVSMGSEIQLWEIVKIHFPKMWKFQKEINNKQLEDWSSVEWRLGNFFNEYKEEKQRLNEDLERVNLSLQSAEGIIKDTATIFT